MDAPAAVVAPAIDIDMLAHHGRRGRRGALGVRVIDVRLTSPAISSAPRRENRSWEIMCRVRIARLALSSHAAFSSAAPLGVPQGSSMEPSAVNSAGTAAA